jgi:hypothetical protein
MAMQVCQGAALQCSFGTTPSVLNVLPTNAVMANSSLPAANIMDHTPYMNILPFGMCTSLANPTVASATAAAQGVLTPQACTPVTSSPWVPGSPTVLLGDMAALNDTSTLTCAYGGVIQIVSPGQFIVQIP